MNSLIPTVSSVGLQGDPWPDDVKLFQPYEVDQILMSDFASCLSVKTLLNMLQLQYQIELNSNTEFMSPSGQIPFIKVNNILISEFTTIVRFLNAKGYSLTLNLSAEEVSDMNAYINMVQFTMNNALLYFLWMDQDTYRTITKVRYGHSFIWPLNYFLPFKKRRNILQHLTSIGWSNYPPVKVYKEVEKCLETLTNKLGEQEYFFGNGCELDALVFGYLFTILTTPLLSNELAKLINEKTTLTALCTRLHETYFKMK